MTPCIEQIKAFYSHYGCADLDHLDHIYSSNVVFKDPVHVLHGVASIRNYFHDGRKGLLDCRFEFHSSLVHEYNATLEWTMMYSHRRLKGGRAISINGCSVFTFDSSSGLVLSHTDYFDLGAMLYEHVPCLGSVVGLVKKGLTG